MIEPSKELAAIQVTVNHNGALHMLAVMTTAAKVADQEGDAFAKWAALSIADGLKKLCRDRGWMQDETPVHPVTWVPLVSCQSTPADAADVAIPASRGVEPLTRKSAA